MDTVIISKATIKIGDTEHELTVEQAKQLHAELSGLFGAGMPLTIIDYRITQPVARVYPDWTYIPNTWTSSGVNYNVFSLGCG